MVMKGFKNTEIGVIPVDWEVFKVKDIASIRTGAKNTQDRISYGLYPFFVRSQTVEKINSFCFDGEAVLTAGDGVGVGKVFHYINGKFDFHQRVYSINTFKSGVSGFYFFKYFQNNFLKRVMQMTAKSSVDSVRMETISEMQIPIPPISEQKAIAKALSDADAWIANLEQTIVKKRLIKQGAMQLLLSPKEDWEMRKLGELVEFLDNERRPIKSNERQHGIYPYYGASGIIDYVADYIFEGEYLLLGEDGENILSRNLPLVYYVNGRCWINNHTHVLKCKDYVHSIFLLNKLEMLDYKNLNSGTAQPKLNKENCYNGFMNATRSSGIPTSHWWKSNR